MSKGKRQLLAGSSFGARSISALPALFALACATGSVARAEGLTDVERRNANQMLEGVHKTIEAGYYDPSFKGLDLAALANVAKERIGKAGNIAEALAAIAQFELELDDLHTTFSPPWLTVAVDYGWKMGMVGNNCYVIALDPQSDAAHQGVAIGDQVKSVNGFVPTRSSLWRLNYLFNNLHPLPGLHVELISPTGQARTLDLAAKVHPQRAFLDLSMASNGMDRTRIQQDEEKFWMQLKPVTVRSMPDVLLVRMPSFLLTASEVKRQFRDMHNRAALILDLRGNGGGAEEALNELLGELYGNDLNFATRQMRSRSTAWVVKGAGRNAYIGRVLVLVDSQSASASELFARAMQLTDRGTVIGDQTMGAVMEAVHTPLSIPNGENVIAYGTSVTVADIVMSDGGRLEKVGVTPDFVVLPSGEDLNTGRDPALAQALAFVGHPMDAAAAARLYTNR
jgi:C-terminal processing protease CtpA/Prc